jgi:hypothetical protein
MHAAATGSAPTRREPALPGPRPTDRTVTRGRNHAHRAAPLAHRASRCPRPAAPRGVPWPPPPALPAGAAAGGCSPCSSSPPSCSGRSACWASTSSRPACPYPRTLRPVRPSSSTSRGRSSEGWPRRSLARTSTSRPSPTTCGRRSWRPRTGLLRAPRDLVARHRPGPVPQRPLGVDPGWRLDDHPAVHQERGPHTGADLPPQGRGGGPRDQARTRVQQGGDPGLLPQHGLLGPRAPTASKRPRGPTSTCRRASCR